MSPFDIAHAIALVYSKATNFAASFAFSGMLVTNLVVKLLIVVPTPIYLMFTTEALITIYSVFGKHLSTLMLS